MGEQRVVCEYLAGGADFDQPALRHDGEGVGEIAHDLHVVADHDDGGAVEGALADRLHDGHTFAVVKPARGLIKDDELGFEGHDACERDHLTLAAGEVEGGGVFGQAEGGRDATCPLPCGIGGCALELEAEGDFLDDGIAA
ncbi:Uncharacterised protein [Collinsella intestinalis]|nr:Uncharacterised protein [Collinsella intestinalis]